MTTRRTAAVILALLALAGCAGGEHFSLLEKPAPTAPPMPKVAMAGRWLLAANPGPSCGMRFGGAPGARQGTIAPEGGCPGRFFTSRHWAFENNRLVIKDHNSEPLASLAFKNDRFEGTAVTGMPITLSR